jgi:chromosome partitioning protein
MLMATRTIAVANQKGGVGKTTTSINLAACLADSGQKTLLIDFDPQANATSGLGLEKLPGGSVYEVLLGQKQLASLIVPGGYEHFDVIPSEVDLAAAELDVARQENYLQQFQQALAPLKADGLYSFIVVDCPPSLGILTLNALAAADTVLVPIQCEYYALEGLSVILRVIDKLRDCGAAPNLALEGILMTMFDARTNLSQQVVEDVRKHFGEKVYQTIIPRTVRLSEAPGFGKPIIVYDRHCAAATAYRNLAAEILGARLVPQSAGAKPLEEKPAQTAEATAVSADKIPPEKVGAGTAPSGTVSTAV